MIHYRKSYEVTGYTTSDGNSFCLECAEHIYGIEALESGIFSQVTLAPIFLDSEWDYQPTCDHCLTEVIDCSVLNPD